MSGIWYNFYYKRIFTQKKNISFLYALWGALKQRDVVDNKWTSKPTIYGQQQRTHYGNIQGNLWFMNVSAGDEFLGSCDQNSSYKHVSAFRSLRRYGRLKLRIDD